VTTTLAQDGLIARELTPWAREKLFYIESYIDIFCTGMRRRWTLVYGDLLAGPGLCVDLSTKEEQRGSPLIAAQRSEFDRLFFNDKDTRATDALSQRTNSHAPGRIVIHNSDCNLAVQDARKFLVPHGHERNTLGLIVIDPTAFQMSFDSIQALTAGLRFDLIITYMTGFIRRFIDHPSYAAPMDRLFGSPEWRSIRPRAPEDNAITYRRLLDLYESQLRKIGYDHVIDRARMHNPNGSTIYHLIFASKHPRGADFFEKISRRTYSGQRRLLM
jgi:three-Cys-motif partner protein